MEKHYDRVETRLFVARPNSIQEMGWVGEEQEEHDEGNIDVLKTNF